MSFQRKSGLAPDGVVGPKTLAALKQALLAHG
jgi:peptidoglycan hydrolase-like protein with peptidoglycan-binding domain